MNLLLLGATGLVGSKVLELALSNDTYTKVIAPTRTPLTPRDRLVNPMGPHLEELVPLLMSYRPDALICALGTTQAKAGSRQAFRHIDYELPIVVGKAAYSVGVETYAIVTAMGASATSASFYYRTKGEVERDLKAIGFRSLIICRPSLIGGKRNEARPLEQVALALVRFLSPILPRKFRVNPAEVIAATLIDAVNIPRPGVSRIYAEFMG